jgi:VCBS repeat protein
MRRTPCLLFLIAMLSAPVWALIDPDVTPIDLARKSEIIVVLNAGPLAEEATAMPAKVLRTLKGKAPFAAATLDMSVVREAVATLRDGPLYDGQKALALVMIPKAGKPGAAMHIHNKWFTVTIPGEGKPWQVTPDDADRKAVWAGGTAMLEKAVVYALKDKRAQIPVNAAASWGKQTKLGVVPGRVSSVSVIKPVDGTPFVHVASDEGDKVLALPGSDAERLALAGWAPLPESFVAAWADVDGDGRLELISWDGKLLSVTRNRTDALSSARWKRVLPVCLSLSPVDVGGGRTGLLAGTDAGPVVLALGKDDKWSSTKLPAFKHAEFGVEDFGRPLGCMVADFDGDAQADVVQSFVDGAMFYKGLGGGKFAAPIVAGSAYSDPSGKAYPGDFDADGLLDVLVTGADGIYMWHNDGKGSFHEMKDQSGESDYITKEGTSGGAVGDINNDGRQDFLVLYRNVGSHTFFNRGFECFGYAAMLGLAEHKVVPNIVKGQQAATIADVNGDGAQDLVIVLADGAVHAVLRKLDGDGLSVAVSIPPGRVAGPVRVVGWSGSRCLGARVVEPGVRSAYFGFRKPGVCKLEWQFPGGKPQSKKVFVEEGPVRVTLAKDGAKVEEE